jgi:hypothetical protein
MDGLNEWGPTIVGLGLLAYLLYTYFRIGREQARSRAEEEAAE